MGNSDQPALLIMDTFRDQMSDEVQKNLEENRILVAVIPAGTTDILQLLDLSVNNAAKSFLCDCFDHWYADEVKKQLQGVDDPTTVEVNMSTAVMKELSAH